MIKRNDDNGLIINKSTLALIMVIIALLTCISTVVAYGVTIKSDVEYLKNRYEIAQTSHPETINEIRENIISLDNKIISNQEKIIAIHDDIREIKVDVKGLVLR